MEQKDWFAQRSEAEKEALYRAELEHYSEKMVVNLSGRIIFINSKYAAEFGKRPNEMEGMTLEELFPSHCAPPMLEINDYATPYIPSLDPIQKEGHVPVFIRSPLLDEGGSTLGYMIYDGQDWLQRYRTLFNRLSQVMDEYQYLHPNKPWHENSRFVGESPAVKRLREELFLVAKSNATVLIEGETGVGKEVVANEIYHASARYQKPFIKINCAALPNDLIESELFGYEEGAFTGARRGGKIGLFEQAADGFILLDEINSLGLAAQAKLLRVLQERVVNRIGGNTATPVKARVIAISNKPLEEMVSEESFREDLYYRLNVLHITVPPLRTRKEDIMPLVKRFVQRCNDEMDKQVEKIDSAVYQLLEQQPWPGNARQLQNWVERAMASVWKNVLTPANFYWLSDDEITSAKAGPAPLAAEGTSLSQTMASLEREIIKSTLARFDGNKTQAARALGISRQMLHRKIRQFHR